MLFEPGRLGNLELPNRLVRSATAERMADDDGRPRPELRDLYRELAAGGVGLIITGHMYIDPSGKAHREMTGIHSDDLIPDLASLVATVHEAGGLVAAQINHGGMQCSRSTVSQPLAPSTVDFPFLRQGARAMTGKEITRVIRAYAGAAARAQKAGFDAVQLHGAHGYLINQFLSPFTNRRRDKWGGLESGDARGSMEGRMEFLRAVCQAVRQGVGPDYPLFIKLAMMDAVEGGLSPSEGAQIAAALGEMGLDAIEVSGGIGGGKPLNTQTSIRSPADEGYFRPLARLARRHSSLPIALVGGLRSRSVMEDVLRSGDADFISMSRPLICQPDLPNRFRREAEECADCTSCSHCSPEEPGQGIACVRQAEGASVA